MFSRSGEDCSFKFSFMNVHIEEIFKNIEIVDFILDCEIVAFDYKTNKVLPFQTLSRIKTLNADGKNLECKIFVFDIMYFNLK